MEPIIPFFEDDDSRRVPGIKTVERNAINAIVYNPRTGKVICLDWQKFGWKTFIIGGVEDGEDPVAAAMREIHEETGYRNPKLKAGLGKTRSAYYATHKGENRISNATCFLFELENDERDEMPNEKDLPHIYMWLPREDVASFLTPASQKYIWGIADGLLR